MLNTSCKHEPLFGDDDLPNDSTGILCHPDSVYFKWDVLPILISNCAMSGCHDAATAQDGVILDSYANVMATADVRPFNPSKSDLYEVLIEDKPEKRMPFGQPPLPQEQIQIIAKWILQGAKDLDCDPDAGACDTTAVSYAQFVAPVIQTHCAGCHNGSAPSGNIDLTTHVGVKAVAQSGKLYGAIAWSSGFSNMPQGGNKLPDCTISRIKAWIDAGAPAN